MTEQAVKDAMRHAKWAKETLPQMNHPSETVRNLIVLGDEVGRLREAESLLAVVAPLAYNQWRGGCCAELAASGELPRDSADKSQQPASNTDQPDAALDTNSAANRVASSALGQGAEVGAESHSALNPLEGVARAEVVATPGTPGGGASLDTKIEANRINLERP